MTASVQGFAINCLGAVSFIFGVRLLLACLSVLFVHFGPETSFTSENHDRPFSNFRAPISVDRRMRCGSELSIHRFRGFENVKMFGRDVADSLLSSGFCSKATSWRKANLK